MVAKITTKKPTPIKAIKHHRRRLHRRKSPSKTATFISSINRSFYTCRRRLAKIFSKLVRFTTTPTRKNEGYKILKNKPNEFEVEALVPKILLFDNENFLPPPISPGKRTIFLDLDETLIHSKPDPPPKRFDFIIRPIIDGKRMTFYVLKRPGVDDFLDAISKKYEVVVFTAGLKEYASLVLDTLDKKGVIYHRLYRDSCKQLDGKFVKDLSKMGRDLKKVVIVDDNPNAYHFQPENAIPVKPFTGEMDDVELKKLTKFFLGSDCFGDMRDAVKTFSSLKEYLVWDVRT